MIHGSAFRAVRGGLVASAILAWAFLVYAEGLHGPFLFDDYVDILGFARNQLQQLTLPALLDVARGDEHSIFKRGLSKVSFGLNFFFAGGFDVFAFKLTNLVIHCVNATLAFWLAFLLAGRLQLDMVGGDAALPFVAACATAFIWLVHPIQLTTVLYVVQRMTSLSALCVMAGLIVFVLGRIRLQNGYSGGLLWLICGVVFGGGVGYLFKQNAALIPFFAYAIERFFFSMDALPAPRRRALTWFYRVVVFAPILAGCAALAVGADVIWGTYVYRDFSLLQRLLSEARILFFYLLLIFVPNVRWFSLFHDDVPFSQDLFHPWTTFPALLVWGALILIALVAMRRRRLWGFAVLWYLAGHAMESGVFGLELVFEHRNYLPSFGVFFVVVVYLYRYLAHQGISGPRRHVGPVLLVLVLSFATFVRAQHWVDYDSILDYLQMHHPDSYIVQVEQANRGYRDARPDQEIYADFQGTHNRFEHRLAPLLEMMRLISRAIIAVESGEAPRDFQHRAGNAFTGILPYDGIRLRHWQEQVDERIKRNLSSAKNDGSSTHMVRLWSLCVKRQFGECARISTSILGWMQAGEQNPAMTELQRRNMRFLRRDLAAYLGRMKP